MNPEKQFFYSKKRAISPVYYTKKTLSSACKQPQIYQVSDSPLLTDEQVIHRLLYGKNLLHYYSTDAVRNINGDLTRNWNDTF